VAIEVADTGVGIEAARQAEIFDPFVQVHDRAVRGDRGSGLGLAIARELVRGMDGEIAVTSRPGTGSTFTVTLPAIG
jgi:signal transduction histidine kinase